MSPRAALAALALLLAAPASAQTLPLALPVHGNWCGPGYSGGPGWPGAWPAPPTDPLDAACMRHDICKGARGNLDCGCDIGFMRELRSTPWPNPGLAAKARAMHDAIAMTPCASPEGQAVKMSWVAGDWADDVAAGREPPWAILDRLGRLMRDGLSRGGWR